MVKFSAFIVLVFLVSFNSYSQLSNYKAVVLNSYDGSSNKINGLGVDNKGNSYMAGYIGGVVSISKFSPYGNVIWTKTLNGTGVNKLTADSLGNSYVTGTFYDYTMTLGGIVLTKSAYSSAVVDMFIAKLDSNGNYIWAKNGNAVGYDISLDKSGNCYLVGVYKSGSGSLDGTLLKSTGTNNAFTAKFNSSGQIQWIKTETSKGQFGKVNLFSTTVDLNGNVYSAGQFFHVATIGGIPVSTVAGFDALPFLVKYNSSGQQLWLKTISGLGFASSVVSDKSGSIYLTGAVYRPKLKIGSFADSALPFETAFLVKYNELGNENWVKLIKGSNGFLEQFSSYGMGVSGRSLSIDESNNVYMLGWQGTTTMTVGSSIITNASATGANLFVTKFSPSGNVINTTNIPSDYNLISYSMAVSPKGDLWISGQYGGPKLTIEPLEIVGVSNYLSNSFLVKLTPFSVINTSESKLTFYGEDMLSFLVWGSNLMQNLTLTSDNGYLISLSTGSGFSTSLDLTPISSIVGTTMVYVKNNLLNQNGKITLSSAPAASIEVKLLQQSLITNISTHDKIKAINPYPNPCSSEFILTNSETGFGLNFYNLSGQMVKYTDYNGMPISVLDLKRGLYFVKITGSEANQIFKLTIE